MPADARVEARPNIGADGDRPSAADIDELIGDVALARDELGWTATTPLSDGLARTLEWYAAATGRLIPRRPPVAVVPVCPAGRPSTSKHGHRRAPGERVVDVLYKTEVTPDQIDHLGHMNVRYYGAHARTGAPSCWPRSG